MNCFNRKMFTNTKIWTMVLFLIYCTIQLVIIQVYIDDNKIKNNSSYKQCITALNVLLLIDSCSFFIFINITSKLKDNWIVYYDSILFGLLIGWLILAIPNFVILESFYLINILLSIFIFMYDIWYFRSTLYYSEKSSSNILEISKVFKKLKRKTSFSLDYNKLQRERCSSSEPEEIYDKNIAIIHDDHDNMNIHEENNNNTNTNSSMMIKYLPRNIDITNKAICEGFRINLNLLSEPDPNIPSDLDWEIFKDIDHMVDSSSCHIYTAKWNGLPVILKLIKEERLSSPVAVAEFDIEEAVLSRIAHPNIVRLLGSGKKPRKYLVLEYLSGGTLSQALGIRGDKQKWTKKFSMLDTLKAAYGLAKSLNYLHNEWSNSIHIIHRDVKPDNIGYSNDGMLKLFDFGLCVPVRAQRDPTEQYRMTGNTGTLRYMAPEVVLGRSYHKSVDVYSFGILIWQIATGKIPYQEMGKKSYFDKVVVGGQRPKLYTNWSVGFCELLTSCWNEDKNIRPNFEEIMIELTLLIQEENEKILLTKNYKYNITWIIEISQPIVFIISMIMLVISFIFSYKHPDDSNGWSMIGIIAAIFIYLIIMSYVGIINHRNKLTTSPESIYKQTFKTENPINILESNKQCQSNEIELTSILHENNNNQLTNTTLQRSNDDIVVNNVSFNPILNKDNIHE